jgi:glutathione synthase/RimK-type ligase-like ATP-grasp enzyme
MEMDRIKIAIIYNPNIVEHSTAWNNPWVEYCKENNITYELIDGFQDNIIDRLREFTIVLWHFGGFWLKDMLAARSILYSAKMMGLAVFPDFNDAWHFDDKLAEMYLLRSINAPMPDSYVFYSNKDFEIWLTQSADFPLVAKLRNGSGSHNVKLLQTKKQALKYSKTMFNRGLNSSPNISYKAISNIRSTKSLKVFINRAKRIPEFLRTYIKSKDFPREKDYVLLQEFIPNQGYDLKIVVVGDKLSFFVRNVRQGDFRASGGGDFYYDRKLVVKNIIDSAFRISDNLGIKCMGYDYVVDSRDQIGKVIEMSYGFSHEALLDAGGYFDRQGTWHDKPLNAPMELLKNLVLEKTNI